jgi:hypothetical protein
MLRIKETIYIVGTITMHKAQYLNMSIMGYQQVVRLQISMNYLIGVQILQS